MTIFVAATDALFTDPNIARDALWRAGGAGAGISVILDLPVLRESERQGSPYAATSSSPFAGITVLDSPTGTDFALDTNLPLRATMGETLAPFPSGPTEYWDRVNVLSVKLLTGELASRSEDAILAGGVNAVAIQNADGDWETVQFCDADLVAPSTYDLTTLLRGRLGTEHAMRSPLAAGAPVVLLDGALAQLQTSLAERGVARFYRWGPSGLDQSDPAWQQTTFALRAVALRPWSPVHLAGSRNEAGDLAISWVRRTRFGGIWADGVDVPLNEESERFDLDVLDGSDVVRTLAGSTPSVTYTAAQQVADFGSAQSTIAVTVCQISATVGRGWPASATL